MKDVPLINDYTEYRKRYKRYGAFKDMEISKAKPPENKEAVNVKVVSNERTTTKVVVWYFL